MRFEEGRGAGYFGRPESDTSVSGRRGKELAIAGPAGVSHLTFMAVKLDGPMGLLVLQGNKVIMVILVENSVLSAGA